MSKPRTLLSDLEELIIEFEALQQKLGGRNDMPSNYLQTTAICTLVGMMGVANALIRGADDIPAHEKKTYYFTAKAEFTIDLLQNNYLYFKQLPYFAKLNL